MKPCNIKIIFTIFLLTTTVNSISEENPDEITKELENGCTLIKMKSGKEQSVEVRLVGFFLFRQFYFDQFK